MGRRSRGPLTRRCPRADGTVTLAVLHPIGVNQPSARNVAATSRRYGRDVIEAAALLVFLGLIEIVRRRQLRTADRQAP